MKPWTTVVCAVILLKGGIVWAGEAEVGDPARGRVIYERLCAGCHGPEGRGDGYKLLGPAPADLTAPAVGTKPEGELLTTIHEGKPNMPAWKLRLSDQDARDVLSYIKSLRAGSP